MTTSLNQTVIPSAKRLIKSLRDVGYNFSSAVADIVDNSIEAGATQIDIKVMFEGNDSWVSIMDNGKGMGHEQIIEAMRYGSERTYDKESLGKFGLGLKTASLSQCKILTVASKNRAKQNQTVAYCWDLNHIEHTDKWQILPLKDKRWTSVVSDPLKNTGTVVLWRQLDRLLGYKKPYGDFANKRMNAMCRELEQQLAMIFHRFLSGEISGKKKIVMTINDNRIKPWDPFARNEKKTKTLTPIIIDIEHEDIQGQILLEPFVLPNQQDFSSMDEFRFAAGPVNWNLQQGFYIYRANRLIQSGGWCRLRTPDEHSKLARIALSFSPSLDEAFKINVAKMVVQIPTAYREAIDKAIQPALKLAQERYRGKEGKNAAASALPTSDHPDVTHGAVPQSARTDTAEAETDPLLKRWTLNELEEKMLEVSSLTEKRIIRKVFERLRKKLGANKKHE